jgi:phosphatidylserine decarboxylase
MFRALICSSLGGTVYTTIGMFFVRIMSAGTRNIPIVVCTVPPTDEQISARNV